MGAGASTGTLFDVATELNLNHEQRQRFKAYHAELTLAGMSETRIREKLVAKFRTEKGDTITPDEIKATNKLQPTANASRDLLIESSIRNKLNLSNLNDATTVNTSSTEEPQQPDLSHIDPEDKLRCAICKSSFKNEVIHVYMCTPYCRYIHTRTHTTLIHIFFSIHAYRYY